MVCLTAHEEATVVKRKPPSQTWYAYIMIASVPFLVVTFLVYVILPDLRTLHGKSFMSYVASLAVAYSVLAHTQLTTGKAKKSYFGLCATQGFVIYFSFMLSYFWLNVISFDIWWTFRNLRGNIRGNDRKRLILYTLYAWLSPSCLLAVALCFQFTLPPESRPITDTKCFLQDSVVLFFYYIPAMILTFLNVAFFGITAYKIRAFEKNTEVLKRDGSTKHTKVNDEKQRFWLYSKLFMIMGVNWSFDILSWAAGGPSWLWYPIDFFNSIQGILIFILFIWKPKIRQMLLRKLRGTPSNGSASNTQMTRSNGINMQNIANEKPLISSNKH